MKILIAFDSLVHNMNKIVPYLSYLASLNYKMIPIMANKNHKNEENIQFQKLIEGITNHKLVTTEIQLEYLVTNFEFDAFLILESTESLLSNYFNEDSDDLIFLMTQIAILKDIPIVINLNECDKMNEYINLLNENNLYFISFNKNSYMSLYSNYEKLTAILESCTQKQHVKDCLIKQKKIKR